MKHNKLSDDPQQSAVEQVEKYRRIKREINEDRAPQNERTEGPDEMPGIGSDLKPMNGDPIPAEGIKD